MSSALAAGPRPRRSLPGRLWAFVRWHRKKIAALGVVSGLAVGGYYYAKRMLLDGMRQVEELGRGLQEKMMETQYRQSELMRVRAECRRMINTFLPPLRSAVKRRTDPKNVTSRLKDLRHVKQRQQQTTELDPAVVEEMAHLWDELKVISLTRLFAALYARALLNALLRIQLHVLGRNAFEEASERRKALARAAADGSSSAAALLNEEDPDAQFEPSKITRKVRERVLFSGSNHLVESGDGMQTLVDHVHDAIKLATREWAMGTEARVSRWDLLNMVDAIRGAVERPAGSAADKGVAAESTDGKSGLHLTEAARQWAVKCLVPENEAELVEPDRELNDEQNSLCREMLEETLDMIESPHFGLVMEESCDALFAALHKELQAHAFASAPSNSSASDGLASEENLMLTKVIVELKIFAENVLAEDISVPSSASGGGDSPSPFDEAVANVGALDELCTSIFQQGADDGNDLGLDALGLGDLGLGSEDLQSLAGLFGSLGGSSAGAMPNEAELLKLLGSELGGGLGGSGPAGTDEQNMMNLLQQLVQAGGSPPQ